MNLLANYVKVEYDTKILVHHYHVNFEPEVISFDARAGMVKRHATEMFKDCYIYDKQNTVMTLTRVEDEEFKVEFDAFKGKQKIIFKLVGQISIGDSQMIQFLNCQLRKNFQYTDWVQIMRNFFNFRNALELDDLKVKVVPGIIASIKECKSGVLMAIDTVHKVVQNSNCWDYMKVSFLHFRFRSIIFVVPSQQRSQASFH